MTTLFDDIEHIAMQLRDILQETPKRLEANLQEVTLREKEIMDIEHIVELTNFNAAQGFKYAKEIQLARKRRRELKDEIELLTPLVEVIKKLNVKQSHLNNAIGEIRKVKQHHGQRTYRMRVRKDLQAVVDKGNGA